jgi:hypothetical protein
VRRLPTVDPPRPRWWGQLLLVVGFAWAYDELRSLHGNVVAAGLRHGRAVLHADRVLHVDWSGPLNGWLGHHDALADVLAGYYVVMHLGMTALALLLLWLQGRHYRHHRDALIVASLVGFVIYWCYPVAPPRLLGTGAAHDTVAQVLPFAYTVESKSANLYAAIPSLHVAWAVWVAVAVWSMTSRWWLRALATAHPVITAVTVLATGNHYSLDVAAGVALMAVSYPLLAAGQAVVRSVGGRVDGPEQVRRQDREEQQEREDVDAGAPQAQRLELDRLDVHQVEDHADAGHRSGEP